MLQMGVLIRYENEGDKLFGARGAKLCLTCKTFNQMLRRTRRRIGFHRDSLPVAHLRMPCAYLSKLQQSRTKIVSRHRHELLEWLFDVTFKVNAMTNMALKQHHLLDCYSLCLSLLDLFIDDNSNYVHIDNFQAVGVACLHIVFDCSKHHTGILSLRYCCLLCCSNYDEYIFDAAIKIKKWLLDRDLSITKILPETYSYNVKKILILLYGDTSIHLSTLDKKTKNKLTNLSLYIASIVVSRENFLQYSMRAIAAAAISYAMSALNIDAQDDSKTILKHVEIDVIFLKTCTERIGVAHQIAHTSPIMSQMSSVFASKQFDNVSRIVPKSLQLKRKRE